MILSLMMVAAISGGLTWLVCRYAIELHLVQHPNHRSSHHRPTPSGGGIGFVCASSLVGLVYGLFSGWSMGSIVFGSSLLIALVGLWDDVAIVSAKLRLITQIFVCTCVVFSIPILSVDQGAMASVSWMGWGMMCLLIFVGIWWINLFNFMDGIDGLAATQALFMLLVGAMLSAWQQPGVIADPAWIWMVFLAAAVLGFLGLNWPPAKIFMGDVGSTYLAFMLFVFAIWSVWAGWFVVNVGIAVWLILGAVFVVDATVTLLTRIIRGERWLDAHRSHAYQHLASRYASHRRVTLGVVLFNVGWLGVLATACFLHPRFIYLFVMLAYVPLIVIVMMSGAGHRSDRK